MPTLSVVVKGNIEDLSAKMAAGAAEIQRVETAATKVTTAVAPMTTNLNAAGSAVTTAQTHITGLHGALQQFDGILSSVGVNINSEVRAIGELGSAAGKTVTELGAFATAGLVVGAAVAGWKLGERISEWTGLGKTISDGTAALLHFGDVAEQEAQAGFDELALASQRAGRAIFDLGEARRINTQYVKEHNQHAKEENQHTKEAAAAGEKWAEAMVELNSAGMGWKGTLDTIDGSVVEAIKYYLDAGVAQGTLATAFNLTAVQVRAIDASMKAQVETQKQYAAVLKEVQAIEAQKNDASYAGLLGLSAFEQKTSQQRFEQEVAGLTSIEQAEAKLRDFKMQSSLDSASYQIVKIYETADATVKAFKGAEDQRAAYTKAVMDLADLEASHVVYAADTAMQHISAEAQRLEDNINRIIAGGVPLEGPATPAGPVPDWYAKPVSFGTTTYTSGVGPSQGGLGPTLGIGSGGGRNGSLWGGPPTVFFHYDMGGPVMDSGPAIVHRGEFVVPKEGALVSGGGGIRDVHIHTGHVISTPYELARIVKQALAADDRSLGRVG